MKPHGLGAAFVLVAAGCAGATPSLRAAGERLYRTGISISGAPLEGTVQGDVALSGSQVSCAGCHQRSGMGASEGRTSAARVTGFALQAPRPANPRARPAYTDATLVRAIREGVDAGGAALSPLMPRYSLGDADAAALVEYLKTLSTQAEPGITPEDLHFATVIAPGARAGASEAMLRVLRRYFEAKNMRTRSQGIAASRYRPMDRAYRHWVLHEWELRGPPATWRAQLDSYLRAQPVFALVSGIAGNEWGPVHSFCEESHLPCLLPNVDAPPTASGDFYSLYYSPGIALEAQVAARKIYERGDARVLQVSTADAISARAADAFEQAGSKLGRSRPARLVVPAGRAFDPASLQESIDREHPSALVLWLDSAGLGARLPEGLEIYLSSTLLEGALPGADASARAGIYLLEPFTLPFEREQRSQKLSFWLSGQGLRPAADLALRRVEDQTYFACLILGEGASHLEQNFLRDYLLELIDHISGLDTWSASWPHLSFGPGQRSLSKGAYVVPLQRGTAVAEWVVP